MVHAPTARGRKKATPPERPQATYYVQVLDWEWSFWFGVAHRPRPGAASVDDMRMINVTGRLLAPAVPKVESVLLSFRPTPFFNPAYVEEKKVKPDHVGNMELMKGILECHIYMPADAAHSMLAALSSERLRFVVLEGEKLYRRCATVTHFSVAGKLAPEELQEIYGLSHP